ALYSNPPVLIVPGENAKSGKPLLVYTSTILQFGWAYTSKGLPDFAFSPGTINTGGVQYSARVVRRIIGDTVEPKGVGEGEERGELRCGLFRSGRFIRTRLY